MSCERSQRVGVCNHQKKASQNAVTIHAHPRGCYKYRPNLLVVYTPEGLSLQGFVCYVEVGSTQTSRF
jgi:hypothetical protein